jgi:hypothetical protein
VKFAPFLFDRTASFQLLCEGIIKKLSGVLASIRAILNAPVRTLQAEDSE